jgi:hypothetical protein
LAQSQSCNQRLRASTLADLGPRLAEIRLLTQGAIVAISRLPLPAAERSPDQT